MRHRIDFTQMGGRRFRPRHEHTIGLRRRAKANSCRAQAYRSQRNGAASQVEGGTQNKLPRVHDAEAVRHAIGIAGDWLKAANLGHIADVELEARADFFPEEAGAVTGEQIHVPASWPDGEDHKWLMQSIEAYAIAPSTAAELEAYNLKTLKVELHDLLERVRVPAHFEEKPWNEQAMKAWPAADFDWSLYRRRGTTIGCKLDRVRDADAIEHPFTDWPLLIAMVGRVVAMTRAGNNPAAQAAARAMSV